MLYEGPETVPVHGNSFSLSLFLNCFQCQTETLVVRELNIEFDVISFQNRYYFGTTQRLHQLIPRLSDSTFRPFDLILFFVLDPLIYIVM